MQKHDFHKARDLAGGLLLLATILGSGAGLGYWAGTERTRSMLVDERADRIEEIGRLQRTNQQALDAISGRQARAADTLAAAADTAATAAETAKDAATTADKAATTAGKVAKAAGVPAAALEHDRKAINGTINRANERIKEGGTR